ncbi:MAG: FecR domain-containing protein [Saonia sp.]
MSNDKSIQKLLEKFVRNECSEEEIKEVVHYFRTAKSPRDFLTVEQVSQLLDEPPSMEKEKADELYRNITSLIRKTEKRRFSKKMWKYTAVAAVFIGLLTTVYFHRQDFFSGAANEVLVPADEAITLKLEDGSLEIISEDGRTQVVDARGTVVGQQQGKQLVYTPSTDTDKLAYNTLSVPYGKRFEVLLSDGSKAYLNSGSSLKYPVKFIQGENRQVFLKGEAYFDISTDKEHPFIVNADQLNIQVLGTVFNVSNYPEDPQTDVVLVEGSVGMYVGTSFDVEKNTILQPGKKGSLHKTAGTIETKDVVTNVYTSWVTGELVFRNMTFANILKKLERHYNIRIRNTNVALGEKEFNASFGNQSIDEVLQSLSTIYGIEYSIANNTIIIE